MNEMIQVSKLEKSYGSNEVLKGISFTVKKGEIFALLGVNGAGKTTALECIEGLRNYQGGSIKVNGTMGVQLQVSTFLPECKVSEALKLFGYWNQAEPFEHIEALGIEDLLSKRYKALSTGQKRRVHLAMALLGDPDIIFLDEPTAGLDVEGRIQLHSEIKKLQAQGKTIILASHDMAEVEELCTRIAVLHEGKLAYIGTPQGLTSQSSQHQTITLETLGLLPNATYEHAQVIQHIEGMLTISTDNIADALLEIISHAKTNELTITNISIDKKSLESRLIEVSKEGLS